MAYQRAKDLCPMNATVHASLAFAKHMSGKREEAIEMYHTALALKPNFGFAADMLDMVRSLQPKYRFRRSANIVSLSLPGAFVMFLS